MFPSRTARALSALLDVADALLAPVDEQIPEHGDDATTATSEAPIARTHSARSHPHRRPLASQRRRRLAPPQPEHACTTPVARTPARRAPAPTAAPQLPTR